MGVMLVVVPKGAKSERRTFGDPKVAIADTRQEAKFGKRNLRDPKQGLVFVMLRI